MIEADAGIRMVVVAGPGTGKTEVACARIAHLVDHGLSPSSVLVLSFTRAATSEMRQRIARNSLKHNGSTLAAVEIRTLDSLAWLLQRNIKHQNVFKTYGENISDTLELLEDAPEALREYLDSMQLLVIDEAQDLVGIRARLTMSLIGSLSQKAGVLVLIDPAQAIYGDWAVEEAERGPELTSFEDLLDSRPKEQQFEKVDLKELHRTQNPNLIKIAKELRVFAIAKEGANTETYQNFRRRLTDIAGEQDLPVEDLPNLANQKVEQFFLFRTHGEAVQVSSYLSQSGISHRLRFPGLPKPVHPWIGHLLWNYTRRELTQPNFMGLWKTNLGGTRYENLDSAESWKILMSVASNGSGRALDVLYLREAIDRLTPPDELCLPAVGMVGPILGTIHGSKGRETDEVVLFISANELRPNADHAEETRVLYVGATRAKRSLLVAGFRSRQGYLSSRRAWATAGRDGFQIEFGLVGDVDPLSPVSKILGGDSRAISTQQKFAQRDFLDTCGTVEWVAQREAGWARVIQSHEQGTPIGFCGRSFENDLWELARKVHGRPPNLQRHLYVVDFTTVARRPTSPDLNLITNSFAASGFWVAPIIKGYSIVIPQRGGQ